MVASQWGMSVRVWKGGFMANLLLRSNIGPNVVSENMELYISSVDPIVSVPLSPSSSSVRAVVVVRPLSVRPVVSRRRRRRPLSVRPSRRRRPSSVRPSTSVHRRRRPSSVRPSRRPSNNYLHDVA